MRADYTKKDFAQAKGDILLLTSCIYFHTVPDLIMHNSFYRKLSVVLTYTEMTFLYCLFIQPPPVL